jgi:hypothetical protein
MLLDVNVLLALAWPNHQFHEQAHRWFAPRAGRGWSTCAVTQLGFIRLSSNPAFTEQSKTPVEAARLLQAMTRHGRHRFLAESPEPAALASAWERTAGHKQTTDVYLATMARHHGTKLATFDGPLARKPELRDAVELLPSSEPTSA